MAKKEGTAEESKATAASDEDKIVVKGAVRRRLPARPQRAGSYARVADLKGYFTVGEF